MNWQLTQVSVVEDVAGRGGHQDGRKNQEGLHLDLAVEVQEVGSMVILI